MRVIRVLCIVLVVLILGWDLETVTSAQTVFRGRIIAHRPSEGLLQWLDGDAANHKSFLIEVDSGKTTSKRRIVRVLYQHYKKSAVPRKTLDDLTTLLFKGKEDKTCEQTYEQFVRESHAVIDFDTKIPVEDSVVFATQFLDIRLPAQYVLKCYRVTDGGIKVMK